MSDKHPPNCGCNDCLRFNAEEASARIDVCTGLACPGEPATCLCDTHVWARHEEVLATLRGRKRKAARGKLLGSDFAVADKK